MKLSLSLFSLASATVQVERFLTQEVINCEHAHLGSPQIGTCPLNKVMRVLSAYYGRWDASTCHGGNSYSTFPECSVDVSLFAKAACDGHKTCDFNGNNNDVFDPCRGITKYTVVSYKCEDPLKIEDAVYSSLSCEHSYQGQNNRRINCPFGKVIEVVEGNYGRDDVTTCNKAQSTHSIYTNIPSSGCARDTTSILAASCNGQQGCSISMTNGKAGGDPCRGVTKYSSVDYKCVNRCQEIVQPVFDADSEVSCITSKSGSQKCTASCTGARSRRRRNRWSCNPKDETPVWRQTKSCK